MRVLVVLFEELVELASLLESTASRNEKVSRLAAALKGLDPEEAAIVVRLITGEIFPAYSGLELGVGYSTLLEAVRGTSGVVPLDQRKLSVREVYESLVKVANASGEDSRNRKLRALRSVIAGMSRREVEFLARFLLGEPRLGAREGIILEALARAVSAQLEEVRRAYMFSGDLGDLAQLLLSGVSPSEVRLRLFHPVKPMLAEMARSLREALRESGGRAALEFKYDGVRLQVHKRGGEVRLFTRRLTDVTSSLPDVVELVLEHVKAEEAVIDCEAVSFKDGKPLRFQDLVRRVRRKEDVRRMAEEMPFEIKAFDVLYLDGRVLVDEPYEERWKLLEGVASPEILIERVVTGDLGEAESFYRRSLEAGNEGVMVKRLDSPYTPGVRGRYWFKVKPAETLDLVIVGAEWGHGRRRGWLSDYYLAARNPETGEFLIVGKTFKGLTDTEFEEITRKLLELKVRDEGWRVWVKPSIVAEVAFSEVQKSPKYRSGYALRFARIIRLRPDKQPEEAATIHDVRRIYEEQFLSKAKAE
ncbi:MAG: ATP-dependent DNA ligase [Thermofilum sp.]